MTRRVTRTRTRREDPLRSVSTRATPQRERADDRQVRNSAGGYVFSLDARQRLRRFLTLGVTGGTYYVSERALTQDNFDALRAALDELGAEFVVEVVRVSSAGRAPRNDEALFALALAMAHGNLETRRRAMIELNAVARTGTHVMQFNNYVTQFRGRGRILDRAIENWYLNQDVKRLALQVVKYRQREGWTHRDLLRLAKPKAREDDIVRRALFDWVCHRSDAGQVGMIHSELAVVEGFERAQHATNAATWAKVVREYRLPWEALPTQALNQARVWEALLEIGVPSRALMRQLPRLTNLGLLPNVGGWTNEVVHQLTDADTLTRARLHPIAALVAHKIYARGHSEDGDNSWTPTRRVVDALDASFYAAFGAVQPTGKRVMLALDVSGSMTWANVSGLPITPRDASAALALVTAAIEPSHEIVGFHSTNSFRSTGRIGPTGSSRRVSVATGIEPLTISPRQRLDDVIRYVNTLRAGGTDCALPMLYALETKLEVDAFVIYTDSETWHGGVHPYQALTRYRQATGIDAALCVVGMTATQFTIADPRDTRSLDVVGFDAATPQLLGDFIAGNV